MVSYVADGSSGLTSVIICRLVQQLKTRKFTLEYSTTDGVKVVRKSAEPVPKEVYKVQSDTKESCTQEDRASTSSHHGDANSQKH